jgi:hypothetical protein
MGLSQRDKLATWAAGAAFCIAVATVDHGFAESPLASLVSADVGLVIEVRRLAEHVDAFGAGPNCRRVSHYPPFEKWAHENGQFWNVISAEVVRRLGAAPVDIVTKLLGTEVLFAVWPPDDATGQGDALLLVRAADEPLLQTVLDRLVAVHRESGQWKGEHLLAQAGRKFVMHEIETRHDQPRLFLAVSGLLGVVSTNQRLVGEALAGAAGPNARHGTLADLPAYRAAAARLAGESVARLFVNPRAWDAPLAADLRKKQPGSDDARTQAVVVETWKATQYLAASIEVDSRLSLEGFVKWDRGALPDAVREATDSVKGPAEFLNRVPADAMVTLVGRVDVGRLLAHFGMPRPTTSTPSASTHAAGASAPGSADSSPPHSSAFDPGWFAVLTFAGGLGADFGAYLVPRHQPAADESREVSPAVLPFDGVAVLHTTSLESRDERPALAELIEPLLHRALVVATQVHNARHPQGPFAEVRSLQFAGLRLTSVVGLVAFPRGLEAAYAVVDRCLLAGTSSEAVRQAAQPAGGDSLARSPLVHRPPGTAACQPKPAPLCRCGGHAPNVRRLARSARFSGRRQGTRPPGRRTQRA